MLGRQTILIACKSVHQDSVGCPPRVATGELDGKVVAIKLFCEDEEYEPGHQHDAQPGNVVF